MTRQWIVVLVLTAAGLCAHGRAEAQVLGGGAYNPYTGNYAQKSAYNAYTGRYFGGRTYYNPYTNRYQSGPSAYNPWTGNYGYRYPYGNRYPFQFSPGYYYRGW